MRLCEQRRAKGQTLKRCIMDVNVCGDGKCEWECECGDKSAAKEATKGNAVHVNDT